MPGQPGQQSSETTRIMKTDSHRIITRQTLRLVCTLIFAASLITHATPEYKPAEESGWVLVFEDNFDRDELGEDWVAAKGNFGIKNGNLSGSGVIFIDRGFPDEYPFGFQRIEVRAKATAAGLAFLPGARPTVSDLSMVLHAQDDMTVRRPYGTGYMFQFGGETNQLNRIQRQRSTVIEDTSPGVLITPGKYHDIVAENDMGTLRLWVDGKLLLEQKEMVSLLGKEQNRVGLYFYTGADVENVKVYLKRLPDGYERD